MLVPAWSKPPNWAISIAALLLTGCTILPDLAQNDAVPSTSELRIATWNIEHLAGEPGQGCEPRDLDGYGRVADVIDSVDSDIWLLQEVENADALARVFDAEDWTFHLEQRPSTGEGPLCRGREDGRRLRMQRTAIVVRNGIDHVRGADLAGLDVDQQGRLRHGVRITVPRDEYRLDIMSVHLKSGCFYGDDADACPTLFAQIPVLEAWVDQQSAEGRAVIVGGDFNRRLAAQDDEVWQNLNDGDPFGLAIAGEGARTQCDPRYSEFIDFLVMNELAEALVVQSSFEETVLVESNRASDHCPISISVRQGAL